MIHSFDIDDAKNYGVTEAVILYNLKFWIEKNKANNRHFYENRYWTYNSIKAFEELFPYLSYKQIRSAIENLEKKEVIITGNFNASSYDRTKWYAIKTGQNQAIADIQNGIFDLPKKANGNAEMGKTVNTDINTNNKQDIKPEKAKSKTDSLTLATFLANCLKNQEKPISQYTAVWNYAENAKIPENFIILAWMYFCDKYEASPKKYANWRLVFLNAIKGNWLKLWYIGNDGNYMLTTTGQQFKKSVDNSK